MVDFEIRHLGRYIKAIDQVLGLSNIPIFNLENINDHGMVPLFVSMLLRSQPQVRAFSGRIKFAQFTF